MCNARNSRRLLLYWPAALAHTTRTHSRKQQLRERNGKEALRIKAVVQKQSHPFFSSPSSFLLRLPFLHSFFQKYFFLLLTSFYFYFKVAGPCHSPARYRGTIRGWRKAKTDGYDELYFKWLQILQKHTTK